MCVFYIFGLPVYNLRPNQTINFLQDAATDVAELLEPSRRLFFSFFPAWLTSSRSEQGNMRGDLPTLSPRQGRPHTQSVIPTPTFITLI